MTIISITSVSIIIAGICYLGYKKFFRKNRKISFKEALDLTELPIITFHCANRKLNFLLDTGSNICHINKSLIDEDSIVHEKLETSTNVFGIEGNKVSSDDVVLTLKLGDNTFRGVFSATDMAMAFEHVKKESGVTLHGILGTNFFNAYKYIIDFDKYVAYSKK